MGTMSKQLSMASRLLDVKEQHFQISLIRLIHQFFFFFPLFMNKAILEDFKPILT